MTVQPKRFVRKPFEVEALQVTDRNFSDMVEWCEGEAKLDENHRRFIEVPVRKPINKRQTTAYVGDFIVLQRKEFKVFKNSSFRSTFDEVNELIAEQLVHAGHAQLEIEETNDGKDQHITVPRRTKHGQNGWNTKVADKVDLQSVSLTHDGPGEILSVTDVKENNVTEPNPPFSPELQAFLERPEIFAGYTYEEAMAAARAGDGNMREKLDEMSLNSAGIVYDWSAPYGHELDEAIRIQASEGEPQKIAPEFDTDGAAVTVVQVDPDAVMAEAGERNYPREVEADRPIGI